MSRFLGVTVVAWLATATAGAEPIRAVHVIHFEPTSVPTLVNSHVVFLNRCSSGCQVLIGTTDSRSDHSDIGHGTLSAYPYGDSRWQQVVSCVKGVMAPFNITVTDQDPGTADHFEVMVAGSPGQLGLSGGVGGIADYACNSPGVCSYVPNALVFDFTDVWGGSVTQDCGTIAQEVAHAWTLDHSTVQSSPMTYYPYQTPLAYHDGAPCGSDCSGGQSPFPFSLPCSNNMHTCMSTGTATQNEAQLVAKLFGPAGAAAPTVKITSPANDSAQQSGFQVQVTCTSGDGVQEVDLSIDGVPKSSLTSSPYNFTTPMLVDGSHDISVTCATNKLATATAEITIVVGQKCSNDQGCPDNDICYNSACIAGPNAPNGLGATCTSNDKCASGQCASDGTMQVCVVPCDTNNDHCPAGFGCLPEGATGGVCWPGAAHGPTAGGCCDASGGVPDGPIVLSFGVAGVLVLRRRRPRRGVAS
jgi:uncharacterized protein (TIGR03382 family)